MINVGYIIIEFYGTIFLTYIVCVSNGNPYMVAACLGSLIIGSGGVSGAHYNPAVTIGFILKNWYIGDNTLFKTFLIYFPIQFIGAPIGALLAWATMGTTFEID
jgi:glycerol uptake facilitator-like aquaporin